MKMAMHLKVSFVKTYKYERQDNLDIKLSKIKLTSYVTSLVGYSDQNIDSYD